MSIRILLADDHRVVREGLRFLIEKQSGMKVVAEAEDGRTTVQLTRKLSPTLVIMDITMPGLNGMEATREILSEAPGVKVIALSMHSDKRFVAGMLNTGASGYLTKDCAFEELISAILTVVAGQTYLSPQVTSIVVEEHGRHLSVADSSVFSLLTAREREVLQLIAKGKTTKEIASILGVSVKTVETHRQHIVKKLGLRSVAELTRYALREGLTSLEE